MNKSENRI